MRRQWALAIVVTFVAGSLMMGTMASAQSSDNFQVDSFFDVFYDIDLKNICPPGEIPRVNPDLSSSSCSPEFLIDSFFDVFYEIDFQVDSFFDVFYDITADGTRNTIEPLAQLFGDPDFDTDRPEPVGIIDSFFDIFVEIDARDRHFDTEMLSLQLTSTDPATGAIPDSFFDVWTEISVHNEDVADLQRQLDGHVTVLKAKDDGHDKDIARIDTEILSMDLRVSDLEDNPPQASTTAAFIKIGEIEGESVESSHKEWSDLTSCNQGQSVSEPSGPSRQRASVSLGDVVCVKELDKASPKIAEAVLTGEVFPKVGIHFTASYGDAGRLVYYAYELTNVRVTSYNIGGSGQGDDVPTENFSLNFEEIKVTYTERDSKGEFKSNVEYSWKVEEGEA